MAEDEEDDIVPKETNNEKTTTVNISQNELTNDFPANDTQSKLFYQGSKDEGSFIANKPKQTKTTDSSHTNEEESPYELIQRGSMSVSKNERVSISRMHRRRPKGKEVKSMYVVGDSMVAFKDGIPGSFSPLSMHSTRRNVKSVPVFPQEMTLEPERPPRKNRLKFFTNQQAKICKYFCKVFYGFFYVK